MFNLQASPEQLMEVEPRSQSPAANSETELDFAKRSRSVEDLNKVDDVERDLESSSSSLDAGGVIQGRPSSNYSVQCKVDLRNVQTRKGKSKPAALEDRSGFGSDILNSLPLGSTLKKPANMALEEPPDSPTSVALGSVPRQPANMALEKLPDSAEFFAGLQGGRATTSSQVPVEEMEEREEGQRMSSVGEEEYSVVDLHQDTRDAEVVESYVKEVDTNQFSTDAPTALEAHLAVTRQLGLEESTYSTAARHESSSNTKNNQDAEDSLDDGSSSRVGHHGEDDRSPFQAPKVDEQVVPLQEEVGPDQPTPQAKATGSNSRLKNAGIIQEEGDCFEHEVGEENGGEHETVEEEVPAEKSTLPATASGSGSKVGVNMFRHGVLVVGVGVEHHEEDEVVDEFENDDGEVDHVDGVVSNQGEESSQRGAAEESDPRQTPTRTPVSKGRRTLLRKPTVWVKDKVQEEGPKLLGVGRSKDNQVVVVLQGLPSDIDSEVEMVRTSLKKGAGQPLPTREEVDEASNQEGRQGDLGGEEADDEGGRVPRKKLRLITVPAPKRRVEFNRKFRAPYSRMEEQAIIDFLLEEGGFGHRKGIRVWRWMEEENICPGRSALALKHQFLQHIMKRLPDFGVTEEDLMNADDR